MGIEKATAGTGGDTETLLEAIVNTVEPMTHIVYNDELYGLQIISNKIESSKLERGSDQVWRKSYTSVIRLLSCKHKGPSAGHGGFAGPRDSRTPVQLLANHELIREIFVHVHDKDSSQSSERSLDSCVHLQSQESKASPHRNEYRKH